MEDYPRTLAEFEARFRTEDACRAYLVQLRWPDGFRCPACVHGKAWPVRDVLFDLGGHPKPAIDGHLKTGHHA